MLRTALVTGNIACSATACGPVSVSGYAVEGGIIGGQWTLRHRMMRMQSPLVQVAAALAALVDAGQDTVVREVEQCLRLLRSQSHIRIAHGQR